MTQSALTFQFGLNTECLSINRMCCWVRTIIKQCAQIYQLPLQHQDEVILNAQSNQSSLHVLSQCTSEQKHSVWWSFYSSVCYVTAISVGIWISAIWAAVSGQRLEIKRLTFLLVDNLFRPLRYRCLERTVSVSLSHLTTETECITADMALRIIICTKSCNLKHSLWAEK